MKSVSRHTKTLALLGLILPYTAPLLSQVSLWQDHNPYREQLQEGKIIRVQIDEPMVLYINHDWEADNEYSLKLVPDSENLEFLKQSEVNKTRNRNDKARYRLRNRVQLQMTATLMQADAAGNFTIEGSKSLVVDGKPGNIVISGTVAPRFIEDGVVKSADIADFRFNMTARIQAPRDNRVNMVQPQPGGAPGTATEAADPRLSEADRNRIILQYMQEILGAMGQ